MNRAARAEVNAIDGDVAVELTMGTGGTADIVAVFGRLTCETVAN